jgi:L-asparaginase II
MAARPEMVGGTRQDVTALMRAVPGLVAKDGFEGVYVAALDNGTAVAIKAEDGSDRASQVALAAILVGLGAEADALTSLLSVPVLGGGREVGQLRSPLS